jgi:hypothetical protein
MQIIRRVAYLSAAGSPLTRATIFFHPESNLKNLPDWTCFSNNCVYSNSFFCKVEVIDSEIIVYYFFQDRKQIRTNILHYF